MLNLDTRALTKQFKTSETLFKFSYLQLYKGIFNTKAMKAMDRSSLRVAPAGTLILELFPIISPRASLSLIYSERVDQLEILLILDFWIYVSLNLEKLWW